MVKAGDLRSGVSAGQIGDIAQAGHQSLSRGRRGGHRVAVYRRVVGCHAASASSATTGLDPILVNSLHQKIREQHLLHHFTAVIVSHELPEIFSIATHVAMLHGGRIVAQGPPAVFQACQDPVVQQFLTGQIEGPIEIK